MERQIVLDTETTGLEVELGHRIIEIGCVELRNRRPTGSNVHRYFNPERAIDLGAQNVHGISEAELAAKPRFAELAKALWDYLHGAELVIHNAAFDLGFLNAEFRRAGMTQRLEEVCTVIDTLALARRLHPGQKANLDALCRRYGIDNSRREFHGALLDAQLLAEVYLAMTGGQVGLALERAPTPSAQIVATTSGAARAAGDSCQPLRVIRANAEELAAHRARLEAIAKKSGRLRWSGELE
ncbi:MAG: DNA polymerase III subunit epsilon [Sinobacteraceae bacterium]|nr:DNA polymerase III subunit epsilon [Nevskiaceae bacterium]